MCEQFNCALGHNDIDTADGDLRRRKGCRNRVGLRESSRGGITNGCFQRVRREGGRVVRQPGSAEQQRSLEPTPPPTAVRQFWACQESHTSSRDMPQTSLRRLSGPLSHRGRGTDWRCAKTARSSMTCPFWTVCSKLSTQQEVFPRTRVVKAMATSTASPFIGSSASLQYLSRDIMK